MRRLFFRSGNMADLKNLNCIGILGGTFNPVHNGHLMMAECAVKTIPKIEHILFMPNNFPGYKDASDIVSTKHRLEMLALALHGRSNMSISDLEIKRGGITYTAETLECIHKQNPKLKIYFIIGSDSLYSFKEWFRYRDILAYCTLLVAGRHTDMEKMQICSGQLKDDVPDADIVLMHNDDVPAASSEIREMISHGCMPWQLLPHKVAEYIMNNGLYSWKNSRNV